jgi:hypothetical protein
MAALQVPGLVSLISADNDPSSAGLKFPDIALRELFRWLSPRGKYPIIAMVCKDFKRQYDVYRREIEKSLVIVSPWFINRQNKRVREVGVPRRGWTGQIPNQVLHLHDTINGPSFWTGKVTATHFGDVVQVLARRECRKKLTSVTIKGGRQFWTEVDGNKLGQALANLDLHTVSIQSCYFLDKTTICRLFLSIFNWEHFARRLETLEFNQFEEYSWSYEPSFTTEDLAQIRSKIYLPNLRNLTTSPSDVEYFLNSPSLEKLHLPWGSEARIDVEETTVLLIVSAFSNLKSLKCSTEFVHHLKSLTKLIRLDILAVPFGSVSVDAKFKRRMYGLLAANGIKFEDVTIYGNKMFSGSMTNLKSSWGTLKRLKVLEFDVDSYKPQSIEAFQRSMKRSAISNLVKCIFGGMWLSFPKFVHILTNVSSKFKILKASTNTESDYRQLVEWFEMENKRQGGRRQLNIVGYMWPPSTSVEDPYNSPIVAREKVPKTDWGLEIFTSFNFAEIEGENKVKRDTRLYESANFEEWKWTVNDSRDGPWNSGRNSPWEYRVDWIIQSIPTRVPV